MEMGHHFKHIARVRTEYVKDRTEEFIHMSYTRSSAYKNYMGQPFYLAHKKILKTSHSIFFSRSNVNTHYLFIYLFILYHMKVLKYW